MKEERQKSIIKNEKTEIQMESLDVNSSLAGPNWMTYEPHRHALESRRNGGLDDLS